MKKKRLFVLALAALMGTTALAGCGQSSLQSSSQDSASSQASESSQAQQSGESVSNSDTSVELSATKLGTVNQNLSTVTVADTAMFYKTDDDMYGILSLDGTKDTGAKYTYCGQVGDWFAVCTTNSDDITDIASINCVGVVDKEGNEIVPMQYAAVDEINERYIKVCEVTEKASGQNDDDALVYLSNDMFSLGGDDDDTYYKGNWYIYDAVTGKKLDGATGSKPYSVIGYGNFVKYTTDDKEQVTVNNNGDKLPNGADLLDNGCYTLTSGNTSALYDSDGNKLFDYDADGFVPAGVTGDYIYARKYVSSESSSKYVLLDSTGTVASAEFSDIPSVYGALVKSDSKLYNFDGEQVISDDISSAYSDEQYGSACMVCTKSEEYVLCRDDKVIYRGSEEDDTYHFNTSYLTIKKKNSDSSSSSYFYCLKDADFTIEGINSVGPWLVEVSANNNLYNVVDTNSGKTIIENYKDYNASYGNGGKMYVYAKSSDDSFDVYEININS